MIYLINCIFSYFYIKYFEKKNLYILIFLFLIWSFIVGLQYNVGVDYFNYYKIFKYGYKDEFFLNNKEYIFYIFLKVFRFLKFQPQSGFIIISIISNLFFFIALIEYKKILKLKIHIFIILYFLLTTAFTSQMNGIRQYLGIYIFFLSGCYLMKDKKKYIILNIFSGLIHTSLFLGMSLIFLKKLLLKKYKESTLFKILLVAIFLSLYNLNLKQLFNIIGTFGKYNYYLGDKLLEKNINIIFKITKWINAPIYIYSILSLNKMKLRSIERVFFNLGIFCYSLKLISLISFLSIRVSEVFNLFIIFPIYFLINYLEKKNKRIEKFTIYLYLFFIFILKHVLFPSSEIVYKNYLFNSF